MSIATKAKVSTGISDRLMDQMGVGYYHGNNVILPSNTSFAESETGAQREKLEAVRYDYMPSRIVNESYGRVAEFGAKKYAPRNWEKGLPQSQIASSLQRHLWAYMDGEDTDPESGLSHLDHALWNAVALVYGEYHDLCDDRLEKVKNIKESP